ncbi:ACP phosphodiesterase [Cedecea colo]|uniref:Acyl carrier protein phosphodiesterase n=1 Tax=Cedecea colo TaxID=2552946 RepID=A0ABX0VQ86_9ENTR|nr:ACP phosphodiesterase [Cedecea colo]NIY48371.1 ACP phosphodiesterase [Cedecea colo]
MNFLAHLHLASLAQSSLLGNLLADFVRGNPDDSFAPDIVAGIYMHRRVDALTDGLPEVTTAKRWFRPETRRVSPITLDVMWDHFVSRHWSTLSPQIGLAEFIAHARANIEPHLPDTPPRFINLNNYLWEERWLERYSDMAFIANVLNGMASRRPKLGALRASWQDLEDHYEPLEELFWQFYPRMMSLAEQKSL